MKHMPTPALTPPGMYINVVMNLFFIIIFSEKDFDTGIYRPTSLHVLSRLPRVGHLHEVAKRWPNSRFNLYSVTLIST